MSVPVYDEEAGRRGRHGAEIEAARIYKARLAARDRPPSRRRAARDRLRFLREITDAVAQAWAGAAGCSLCPLFASTPMRIASISVWWEDPHHTYIEAVKILEEAGIAYHRLQRLTGERQVA